MKSIALKFSNRGPCFRLTITVLGLLLFSSFQPKISRALAADPITSSGLDTQINLSGTRSVGTAQYDITGGTRVGTNLFHSFGEFSVPSNNIANFLNDSGLETSNILGRVTGGQTSSIFGTLQTSGFENANLFLMNPSGIVFGPTAKLNVGGSVAFTTADYLRLTDSGRFSAIPNATADALLSTAPVAAYGFLESPFGVITVEGSRLSVSEGSGISLVGGNITVQSHTFGNSTVQPAHLSATGGKINIASVASPGEILAGTLEQASNINGLTFGALGTIQVLGKSTIDASGKGGGTVLIRGGQFVLDDSKISANVSGSGPIINGAESIGSGIDIIVSSDATIRNNSIIETDVTDNATTGVTYKGMYVKADHLEIRGTVSFKDVRPGTPLPDPTSLSSKVSQSSSGGNSGNIMLEANSILLGDWASLNTTTEGAGNGGNIHVTAEKDLKLDFSQFSSTSLFTDGNTGNIDVASKNGNIFMENNSLITTQTIISPGTAGTITVSAPNGDIHLADSVIVTAIRPKIGEDVRAAGSGRIDLSARNLKLDGGVITADNFASLKPGNITARVSGSLNLRIGSLGQSANIQTASHGAAPSADLNIQANRVLVTDGSFLSTQAFNSGAGGSITIKGLAGPSESVLIDGPKSAILSGSVGTGPAGDIVISSDSVTLQNSGTLSAETTGTDSTATGGSITVNATDQITLTNGASITASSIVDPETPNSGIANAGNIFINAGQQLEVLDDSSITTQAAKASGGNIDIRAIDRIRFVNSTVSTSVLAEDGKGGNIFIDPNVVILEGSEVTTKAVGGAGGNITFVTPLFLADSASLSLLSAKSESGLNGTVLIQSPTSNLSGAVGQLVSKTSPPQVLLQNRCVALAGGEQSTFLLAGRDALPSEPGGWLSSPVAMEHWTGEVPEEHVSRLMVRSRGWNIPPPLTMAKNDTTVLSLRRLTPPGFLVRSFATAPTGCPS